MLRSQPSMMDACNGMKEEARNEKNATKSLGHQTPLRSSLFEPDVVARMQEEYNKSQPYHHLVIPDLMDDGILEGARGELKSNMHATLKETDIFKVYQTGDLANMDGLPEDSKLMLPSLFAIRNGLYSLEFRRLVQSLTGSGPLSGEQIDLSVNAFGHTGHLLCHDDVIGTRKVSYILYLVEKDWGSGEKPDGGGLQLYPLEKEGVPGIPAYAPSKTIAPRWNQMVLFAVQPGRSFHDVQEVYSEVNPRLAVSGWFHAARESEMKDWPEIQALGHKDPSDAAANGVSDAAGGVGTATSTLEQLMTGTGGQAACDKDDGAPGAFMDDFVGKSEAMEELAEWVNPEYLSPSMVDQCAAAFNDNGSTIQLHRFLKEDVAKKLIDSAIAADRLDGLGYMEASPFDAGVRGRWRKVGPPHRQRMLRLSAAADEPGDGAEEKDDEMGALLRELRDKLFGSKAFKALLEKLLGGASVVASRRQARRFRPGLDYTLATPGAPWAWKGGRHSRNDAAGDDNEGNNEDDGDEEEEENYMVMDAVLCFVDDREPYKEAAWRQDEVGGYVTYLGGDDDEGVLPQLGNGASAAGEEGSFAEAKGNGSAGTGNGGKNDAAVYKADEGGSLVSVSAASNALSLVLRDDTNITSFVKYVSSAAPGSRFDVAGEYLVVGAGGDDGDSSSEEGVGRGVVLETLPEEDGEEEDEVVEEESARKKLKCI